MRPSRFASLLLTALFAAAALPAETLSLDKAAAASAAKNPALKQAFNSLDQARDRHLAALAAFLPKLSLSAGQTQSGPYDPLSGSLGTFDGGRSGTSLGLSASQNLFRGFGDLAALRQAQAALNSAEEDLRLAKAKAAYDVRVAWSQLRFAQEQADLNTDINKRRDDNVALVRLRFEAGRENKGAVLQTEAQAIQAKADARRSLRDLASARRSLAKALGQDGSAGLNADGELAVPAAPAEGDDATLAESLPGVRKASLALEQAQAVLDGDTADWLPSLNASGSINRGGTDWLPQQGSWSLGLSLSWNFFNGFADVASRRSDVSGVQSQRLALDDARRQALLDLGDARDNLQDSLDQLEVREAFLKAAEARADIARAQYTQGLIGFEDWDRIESDLISARTSSLSGRLGAALSGYAWAKALTQGWEP
jgi:outer membrane protein TolC